MLCPGTLTELIPVPDQEFLDTSLEKVLPDLKKAGVSGLEDFAMAIQARERLSSDPFSRWDFFAPGGVPTARRKRRHFRFSLGGRGPGEEPQGNGADAQPTGGRQ